MPRNVLSELSSNAYILSPRAMRSIASRLNGQCPDASASRTSGRLDCRLAGEQVRDMLYLGVLIVAVFVMAPHNGQVSI